MTEEKAKSMFMNYLYGEIHDSDKRELEKYLDRNPGLRKELNELREVRSVLSHFPVEEPDTQLVMIPTGSAGFKSFLQQFLKVLVPQNEILRTAYAMAVCLILLLSVGALFDMQINYNNTGFQIAFGSESANAVENAVTPDQIAALLEEVKKENALMMAEFIQLAQEQQNQNIEEAFAQFARYMDQQRISDLQLISSDLNSLQSSYYTKFRETDRMLDEIIKTVQTK